MWSERQGRAGIRLGTHVVALLHAAHKSPRGKDAAPVLAERVRLRHGQRRVNILGGTPEPLLTQPLRNVHKAPAAEELGELAVETRLLSPPSANSLADLNGSQE